MVLTQFPRYEPRDDRPVQPVRLELVMGGDRQREGGDPGDRDQPGGEQDTGARADDREPRQEGDLGEHQGATIHVTARVYPACQAAKRSGAISANAG